ncbi:MAG: diaminopimelate epimerase [Gammaproteobacteria bacterium]|nr:diaminopimelate epimerase [Gammaproteobacteria bacterium]
MQDLNFIKMHSLGNDFIFVNSINAINADLSLSPATIRLLADRNYGIGCDQILVCEPPQDMDSDFFMRIYNADGSESEQCGNGARCFMHYVRQQGLTGKDSIRLQTPGGPLTLQLISTSLGKSPSTSPSTSTVHCIMGTPDFNPARVLKDATPNPASKKTQATSFPLELPSQDGQDTSTEFEVYPMSFGNPHLLILQENQKIARKNLDQYGALLGEHPALINGANVGFLTIKSKNTLQLQTFERGSGRTLACGSNASAAYALAYTLGKAAKSIQMEMPGGKASMGIIDPAAKDAKNSYQVYMESVVHQVFSGTLRI